MWPAWKSNAIGLKSNLFCSRRVSLVMVDAHWGRGGPTAPKPWNCQTLPYLLSQTSWDFGDWFGLELRLL